MIWNFCFFLETQHSCSQTCNGALLSCIRSKENLKSIYQTMWFIYFLRKMKLLENPRCEINSKRSMSFIPPIHTYNVRSISIPLKKEKIVKIGQSFNKNKISKNITSKTYKVEREIQCACFFFSIYLSIFPSFVMSACLSVSFLYENFYRCMCKTCVWHGVGAIKYIIILHIDKIVKSCIVQYVRWKV